MSVFPPAFLGFAKSPTLAEACKKIAKDYQAVRHTDTDWPIGKIAIEELRPDAQQWRGAGKVASETGEAWERSILFEGIAL